MPFSSIWISKLGLFAYDKHLSFPLNGAEKADSSKKWFPNLGPKVLLQPTSFPVYLEGKCRKDVKLNKKDWLSQKVSLFDRDCHEILVKPPMQSPFYILKRDIVGPLLSHLEWKHNSSQPSSDPLYKS
jgi:hypothetical protein